MMTISRKIKFALSDGFLVGCLFGSALQGSSSALATGEKLTYHISFDNIENAGFAELQVASAGKLDGRDVVEIRSKVKTLDLVSASVLSDRPEPHDLCRT